MSADGERTTRVTPSLDWPWPRGDLVAAMRKLSRAMVSPEREKARLLREVSEHLDALERTL